MYFRQMSDTGMSPAWAQPGRRFLYSLINFQKMRKVIAAINMTLDGYCDHTYGIADEELHQHYTELLGEAGMLLYGRKTFQLMQYWQELLANPSGEPSLDAFALAIDRVPKLVFSRTLKETGWDSARLATREPEAEVQALKQEEGKDIYAGSPSLITALTGKGLIDEYQLCIHPFIAGKGLSLFRDITETIRLNLVKTKTLGSGAIVLTYQPWTEV